MANIGLITPTPLESEDLRCQINPSPYEEQGVITKGYLHGNHVIFSHCGVGKVNAAHSTTLLLVNNDIDFLVLFGIAGTYSGAGAAIGDVAV
ncbi:MAG: hypothetical protein QSU88_01690, partial [Candidatus Methanoperedens sp.]|nr:hypothetical protein [Candidatus Methanoperedens sp.]